MQLNLDVISAIIFVIILSLFLIKRRKNLSIQKMLYPIFYIILYRTKFGLKWMDRIASRYRELIKFISLCFVGLAFYGLIYVSFNILRLFFQLIVKPKEASEGVALILPFTNIPGIGYLSFWYFIICIFIIAGVHEFSHGLVTRAYNLKLKSSGFGFFSILIPIFPIAFVEPDEKQLEKQPTHVKYSIFAAGPMINITIAVILLLILPYTVNPLKLAPFEDKITESVGISFNNVFEGFPAYESGLRPNIIINKIDDLTIKNYNDFIEYSYFIKPTQKVTLYSENKSYVVTTTYYPNNESKKGYFGVSAPINEIRINPRYKNIAPTYYWLKGLLKWLVILNLLIGLVNLLPILITDGGRMLDTFLKSVFKDKKKAIKVNSFIGLIFLFTILMALVINYGSKLISFLLKFIS